MTTAEELYNANVADLRAALLVYALRLRLVCGEDYERVLMRDEAAKTPEEQSRACLETYQMILSRVVRALELSDEELHNRHAAK